MFLWSWGENPWRALWKDKRWKVHLPIISWLVIWNMKFNFPIILGISSSQLTFTLSFFRGVGWNHQPVSIALIPIWWVFLGHHQEPIRKMPQGILSVDFPRIFKGDATVWQRIDSAGDVASTGETQISRYPMTDPWCWYINANMTGVYWWDPCYHRWQHHGSYGYCLSFQGPR